MRLVLCESCARHVREDGDRCPFCGASAPSKGIAGAPDRVGRLGRAALMAFGVAAGSAGIEGCQKDIAQPYGAPPDKSDAIAIAMPYGAPPERPDTSVRNAPFVEPDASTTAVVDASAKPKDSGAQTTAPTTTRAIAKPYGAPPDPDAIV